MRRIAVVFPLAALALSFSAPALAQEAGSAPEVLPERIERIDQPAGAEAGGGIFERRVTTLNEAEGPAAEGISQLPFTGQDVVTLVAVALAAIVLGRFMLRRARVRAPAS